MIFPFNRYASPMVFGKNYSTRLSVYTVLISLVTIAYQPLHHTWHTWSIRIVFQSCLQNRISKIYRHFLVIFILLSKFSNGALWLVNFRQLENQSNSDYDGSRRKLLNDQLYCECSFPPSPPPTHTHAILSSFPTGLLFLELSLAKRRPDKRWETALFVTYSTVISIMLLHRCCRYIFQVSYLLAIISSLHKKKILNKSFNAEVKLFMVWEAMVDYNTQTYYGIATY